VSFDRIVNKRNFAIQFTCLFLYLGKNWKNLNDIIVAATCIATVIMVGLIILFIYKKRQSFKDIIITKTAVAKSNSYKSNVGCKYYYKSYLYQCN